MKIQIALILSVLLSVSASAHQWFAAPADAKEYKPGDTVQVIVYSTHHFMIPEGVQDASRNAFFVLQNNKLLDTQVTVARNETQKALTASFALPNGAPAMILVNSVGRYSNATPLGAKTATKATVKALGVSVAKTTFSEGWCKIYINPASQDKTFAQPLGLPLEIVPVTNPADITAGKPAVFKVLLRGQPLRNADIYATYKSYNSKDEEAWAVKDSKTDASGQVTVNIPSAAKDIWVVKAAYTADVSGNAYFDAESYTSWAVFAVRK
ncbi:MAG: DUF4198 domain-containing protein [Spirochaetaceae bacterium]|jgi:cobalt/nickel transport protein|nr:DUF4198 domain-containing protein [Spirochaetaceae bacterium]